MVSDFQYEKFQSKKPRVVVIQELGYFLDRELVEGCTNFDVMPWYFAKTSDPIKNFLEIINQFKPDFILSVNLKGCDQGGVLFDLIENLKVPLAIWFLDNPDYLLREFKGELPVNTNVYIWDSSWKIGLQSRLNRPVNFLPLATSHFFEKNSNFDSNGPTSFVGSSMAQGVKQIESELSDFNLGRRDLWPHFTHLKSSLRITDIKPQINSYLSLKLTDYSGKLVTICDELVRYWATYISRVNMVKVARCAEIYGDQGWQATLSITPDSKLFGPLNYYDELPEHFSQAGIHLNFTHFQMPMGVNQRLFDVINAGGVLLTDQQADLIQLFPRLKDWTYQEVSEIPDLIHKIHSSLEYSNLLSDIQKEIREKHYYHHRLTVIYDQMKSLYIKD